MIWFFLCGVFRVAIPTAYVVLAFTCTETARAMMIPFALVVLLIAVYDLLDHRRRAGCRVQAKGAGA